MEFIVDFVIRFKKMVICGMMVQGVFLVGFEINGIYVVLLIKRYFIFLLVFVIIGN